VVHTEGSGPISSRFFEDALENFYGADDVCTPAFVEAGLVILVHEGDRPPVDDAAASSPLSEGRYIFQKTDDRDAWLEGLYLIQHKQLRQAWRLYPDDLCAFASAMFPSDEHPGR
jgi:hypothetical protein